MNKVTKAINEGLKLIDFGNDKIQKSHNVENDYWLIKKNDIKPLDLVFLTSENTFIIQEDPDYILQSIYRKNGILHVGQCVCAAKDSPDGEPKFIWRNAQFYIGDGAYWDNGNRTIKDLTKIPNIYCSHQQSYIFQGDNYDYDGWYNTEILLKYKIAIAEFVKNLNNNCYVPALHELELANRYCHMCGQYWSSTIATESTVHVMEMQSYNNQDYKYILTQNEIDKILYIVPFIRINGSNICYDKL